MDNNIFFCVRLSAGWTSMQQGEKAISQKVSCGGGGGGGINRGILSIHF